jgi:hypothetical protein
MLYQLLLRMPLDSFHGYHSCTSDLKFYLLGIQQHNMLILCCNSRSIHLDTVPMCSFLASCLYHHQLISTLSMQVASLMATTVEHLVTGETMQISTSTEQQRRFNMLSL